MDFQANLLFQSTEGVTLYTRRDRPIAFELIDTTNFYDSKTSVLNHTIGMKNCDDSKFTDPVILYVTIRSNAPLKEIFILLYKLKRSSINVKWHQKEL